MTHYVLEPPKTHLISRKYVVGEGLSDRPEQTQDRVWLYVYVGCSMCIWLLLCLAYDPQMVNHRIKHLVIFPPSIPGKKTPPEAPYRYRVLFIYPAYPASWRWRKSVS